MTTASQTPGEPAEFDALAALARDAQRAGRFADAAAAYRKMVALRPNVAETYNSLGHMLVSQGKFDEAAAQYERAVALNPGLFHAYNNLGNILRQQGKPDQAMARYEQALAFRPDYAPAHVNLANILWQQGKLDQAVARYRQAIALRPDVAEAHHNLGMILEQQGKLDQAAARYEQALALRPDLAEAHISLGHIRKAQGKLDQAIQCFEQALALRPEAAELHYTLGSVFQAQGKLDQAAARYERAIALKPDYAAALNRWGAVLRSQGKPDEAVARYEQALAIRPDFAEVHNNLGNALRQQGMFGEATTCYEQALALKPDLAEAYNSLGNMRQTEGRFDEAIQRYEQALVHRPDYADVELGLAACYLVQGDYERGWPAYESRLRMPEPLPQPRCARWTGQPLAGRSLLLVSEQGMGDTIQFARFGRVLKERGARVVLACPATLVQLLAPQSGWDELFILGSAEELPRTDYYLPLLSVPGVLGTNTATIPCDVPYLSADAALTEHWRRELAAIDGFKIGIVWQGARDYLSDRWRSIPLAQFAPLARVPGVRLISLQKGFGSEQIATVDFPLIDLGPRLDQDAGAFMDTAAVIRNLELVVAPDTGIAHLAGALGAPVWLALQLSPNWRWLLGRDDSPWYPTARLFRQATFDEWPDVFERMAKAVRERRSETASSAAG